MKSQIFKRQKHFTLTVWQQPKTTRCRQWTEIMPGACNVDTANGNVGGDKYQQEWIEGDNLESET